MKNKIYFLIVMVMFGFLSFSQDAAAQANYSIKQMTPEVESALNNRRDRFDQLRELKSQGMVGENSHGYVDVISKTKGDFWDIVEAENKDRKIIR